MSTVLDRLRALGERAGVLATVVDSVGSGSARTGATMVVDSTGAVVGGLTIGGCVDARVREAAAEVLVRGAPTQIEVALGDDDAVALGLACGGALTVELEPAAGLAAVYARAADRARGGGALVVRQPGLGSRLVLGPDGASDGSTGDAALDAAVRGVVAALADSSRDGAAVMDVDGARVLVERITAAPLVMVVGAGEIATALVSHLRVVGMRTLLVEGRESHREAARAARAAGAEAVSDAMAVVALEEAMERERVVPPVVILAHDYRIEVPLIERALACGAAYVGMLASRRRAEAVRQMLAERGVGGAELAKIRAPIGLAIGARTPAEIALSIAAELVAARRTAEGR